MALDLCNHEHKAREDARQKQATAAVLATPRTAVADGQYAELSAMTGLRSFVASLAGHIATRAAL